MKKKKKIILILLFLAFIFSGLDQRLLVRQYAVEAEQITEPVRIVLLTDLHSCKYGTDQQILLDAIHAQNPDCIALAGDIFDDVLPDENTKTVIRGIAERYPCYYVSGNHECWCTEEDFQEKMQFLTENHVQILSGTMENIEIHGQNIHICGIDDPAAYTSTAEEQLQKLDTLVQDGDYSILLSHRPELFPEYQNLHFDLVLCGHAHGGQWRIPGILNGVYAPDQGIFPEYAGGEYYENQVTMLVSRGLARESTRVPRFYNRPELVVIDLQ